MAQEIDRQAPPSDTIGGTAAAAILNCSKYSSPYSAWLKIVQSQNGEYVRKPPNDIMLRGILSEKPVIDMYLDQIKDSTGRDAGELFGAGVMNHKEYPFLHATVDRLLFDDDGKPVGVLEFKSYDSSNGPFDWHREDYAIQQNHYREVLSSSLGYNLTENYLMVASGSFRLWEEITIILKMIESSSYDLFSEMVIRTRLENRLSRLKIEIRPSEDCEKYDVKALADWWTKHVAGGVEPPADWHEDCYTSGDLERTLTIVEGEVDPENEDVFNSVNHLLQIRAALKSNAGEIDKMIKTISNLIKRKTKGIKSIKSGHGTVTWQNRKTGGRLDSDRLKVDHPELCAQYKTPVGSSTSMRVTHGAKAVKDIDLPTPKLLEWARAKLESESTLNVEDA